jgi:hypothetical protein
MVQKFCFALHKKSFPSFLIRFVFDLEEFWSKNVGGTEVPIVYILLCRPAEDSLQRCAIPDSSPPQDWQSTVG